MLIMNKAIIFCSILLASCSTDFQKQPNYIRGDSKRWGDSQYQEIRYFKDGRTNLCFAERGTSNDYSFTCVPCDSIKNLLYEETPHKEEK